VLVLRVMSRRSRAHDTLSALAVSGVAVSLKDNMWFPLDAAVDALVPLLMSAALSARAPAFFSMYMQEEALRTGLPFLAGCMAVALIPSAITALRAGSSSHLLRTFFWPARGDLW
jgi:hypothetical protein